MAQYIVLVIAYLVPVIWLSVKQTHVPVPQWAVGQQLAKVSERERQLLDDPKELEVRAERGRHMPRRRRRRRSRSRRC